MIVVEIPWDWSVKETRILAVSAIVVAGFAVAPAGAAPAATAASLEQEYKQGTEAYEHAFDAYQEHPRLNRQFYYDLSPLAVHMRTAMQSAADPAVRQLAAVYLVNLRDYEVAVTPADYAAAAKLVPAESSLWNKAGGGPGAISVEAYRLPPTDARRFLDAVSARNPDRAIQGRALLELAKLARRERNAALFNTTFAKLAAYKNVGNFDLEIGLINPENSAAVGKLAAPFTLPRITATGEVPFSNVSLSGKYYLIDFWATWCGPCMAERATLASAYAKYRGRNFEIVSVSADKTPDAVRDFQRAHWSMPWVNLFLTGGLSGDVAKAYDVNHMGLPHLVLVDPQGKVIALRDELDRDVLMETLAKYLH